MAAQRRGSDGDSPTAAARSAGNPRFTPSDMMKRMQPVANAARVVPRIMRTTFFDFGIRISPGRSTRDTTKGTHVAVATERVIRNTCNKVPRKSCRGRYRSQKKNSVAGTIQYASTVERTVSNAVMAERDSRSEEHTSELQSQFY